jgi:transcriptional regulator with XRE-family HTH domain
MQLKEFRIEAGYTQEALAERIGCAQSEVSRMERGQRSVTVDRLLRMAQVLKVEPARLLDSRRAA